LSLSFSFSLSLSLFRYLCQWLTPVILATQESEIRRFKASPGK
jgi:hypothetical protein